MKYLILALFFASSLVKLTAQETTTQPKKVINHQVYNQWKSIGNQTFTRNGSHLAYTINPAKGDGFLYIYNVESQKYDSIARGKNLKFDYNNSYLAFLIEPQYDTLRALKLKKAPKSKMPEDSLAVYFLGSDSIVKVSKVKSYSVPDSALSFIVYTSTDEFKEETKQQNAKKGWWIFKSKAAKQTAPSAKASKQEGDNLFVYFPLTGKKHHFPFIDEFQISHDGKWIVFVKNKEDKKNPTTEIILFSTEEAKATTIYQSQGMIKNFNFSYSGQQYTFLQSTDTLEKNKIFSLRYGKISQPDTTYLVADSTTRFKFSNHCPSENYAPKFTKDESRIVFGIAPIPQQDPKDSLLDDEKYQVDIWAANDLYIQPEQKLRINRDRMKTYLTIYDIDNKQIMQIEDSVVIDARLNFDKTVKFAIGSNNLKYGKLRTYDGFYSDYYIINLTDGSHEIVLEKHNGEIELSEDGNFIIYFLPSQKQWFSYDIEAKKHQNLTKDIGVNFYDEKHDMPQDPGSYGVSGWYKNDKFVIINDRYDLWKIDPTGQIKAENLTQSYGRTNKMRLNALTLNTKSRYFNDESIKYFMAFNEITKETGFYQMDITTNENPRPLLYGNHYYIQLQKPENADILFWKKMSFVDYPEIHISDMNFEKIKKITNTNPQQNEYLWGSVELTSWKAFDGQDLSGLIYKPENFDSTKKYPMIVYFYELYSDELNYHYIPKPSHSTINFTEYVSNGYIVFVPDITYKTGYPAKSAYNAIVSGTEHMKKFNWVNANKIGLQGQSWGGYQTAMLVTMTDIYACAEAGAPVSNMTSAYGGIRWGSGLSRAFQYEKTQSRIGYSLWDSTHLYIQNSPLFFADKVKTPLLIMHNDKDGAVPYYQSIEYYIALRRLNKEVWMLTYNNDDHNLYKWPNRVDLSIRMLQFFNHYLKDEPMPSWMANGLPAIDKGKKTGY